MTDEEKLSRAKAGDEYAYGLLCNDSADGLYAVAVLTLTRPDDAREAVKNAFRDGFASIGRIRDKAHLRAWLARELTKHLVAKIKDYRTQRIALSEEDAFSRLPSLDRIVCALRFTFHYNAREIALITGLKEEAVERKLTDSDRRLGKNKAEILMRIAGMKLPDELKTPELPKEEKLKKLTVPTAAEYKRKREEPAPVPDAQGDREKTPEALPREKNEPALDARTFIGVVSRQKIKGKDFLALMGNTRISNEVYREIRENPDLTKERLIELLESSPLTSEDYYKLLSAVKRRNELIERRERANRKRGEAGLFSLDQKKSDEKGEDEKKEKPAERFARTELTKPLPTASKAEGKSALNRRAKPTKPEDRLQPNDPSKTGPFRPIVNTAVLNRLSEDTAVLNRLSEDAEPIGERRKRLSEKRLERAGEKEIAAPKEAGNEKRPAEPIPVLKKEDSAAESAARLESAPGKPETAFRPAPPVFDGDEEEAIFADEPVREKKYKGKEFFIDDDVYYRGVNNGKLAFCAVCAALLFAGSFGIRLLTTGSPLPSENRVEDEKPAETIVIASDEDVLAAAASMKARVQHNALVAYRTSGEPYTEPLSTDVAETEEFLYSRREDSIRAVFLSPEAPRLAAELPLNLSAERELVGFTARRDRFYLVLREGEGVLVGVYDPALRLLEEYRQDGRYVALDAGDELFTLVTAIDPAPDPALPTYRLGEAEKTVGYESVTAAEGAVCGGFAVIGTVSGGEARVSAVLGGYDAYASFEGEELRLLLPDWNTTHFLRFRRIGVAAEPIFSETIPGECFGTDCLNGSGDCAVTYNSAEGFLTVQKRTEEGYAALGGFAAGERLSGVSYSDELVYIVTEAGADAEMKLYCVDLGGEEPRAADANPNAVYFNRLAGFGENLIGLSAETDEDGTRTALLLSVYGYTDEPVLLRTARITVDENTPPEYARYLKGDAEKNCARIAVGENGCAAVSLVYFDGISEVERFLCFRDNGLALEPIEEIYFYDIRSRDRLAAIRGSVFYAVTDTSVTVVDLESGEREYFSLE